MTLLAGLREIRGDVIGIGRALKIRQMARDTGGDRNVVVVVHVAVGALPRGYGVHTGQRETGGVVIECSVKP